MNINALTNVLIKTLKYNYMKEEIEKAVTWKKIIIMDMQLPACMRMCMCACACAHACGICAPACMHAAFAHICWCMCACMACSSHACL